MKQFIYYIGGVRHVVEICYFSHFTAVVIVDPEKIPDELHAESMDEFCKLCESVVPGDKPMVHLMRDGKFGEWLGPSPRENPAVVSNN